MKSVVSASLLSLLATSVSALPRPDVDQRFPYTGPTVPIGDWVDQTINGNGKGFPRLVEPPAVQPTAKNPTNNINVISTSFLPNNGVHIHFQTPFGIGGNPTVKYGTSHNALTKTATGTTNT
jgi:hypothetical protein